MRKILSVLLILLPALAWSGCDLATYRWGCELKPKLNPSKQTINAYCSGSYVSLTKQQYKIMKRYENAYMNMVLKVNDEFISGPCKLALQP